MGSKLYNKLPLSIRKLENKDLNLKENKTRYYKNLFLNFCLASWHLITVDIFNYNIN